MNDTKNKNELKKEQKEASVTPIEENVDDHKKDEALIVLSDIGRTVGEELFLVHLSRQKTSECDFDQEMPRKKARSMSIGEELWQVHVQRSRGLEPDCDTEEETASNGVNMPRSPKSGGKGKAKPARCSERLAKVLHLRNRDVVKLAH